MAPEEWNGKTERRNEMVAFIEMKNDVKHIVEDIKEIKHKLQSDYVSQLEFKPVKMFVYGQTAIILLSVVSAIVMMVMK